MYNTKDIDIEWTRGSKLQGAHWDSLPTPVEHLRGALTQMAAVVRLAQDEATAEDLEALDLASPSDDGYGAAMEYVDSWVLEFDVAHWDAHGDTGAGDLARVEVLLGFGGPNVSLDLRCNHSGDVDVITIEQAWSGLREAVTDDSRALDIARDFVALVIPS